ncbi:hypothetical protein [Mesorhizobium waimense]|uniref:hypothetical protein n=1 Tax=Mesorhizobium waimense TaxID=1300307 RepID=UPI001FE12FFA|nr:hypothetical protein [Mesorhizobium waimense]
MKSETIVEPESFEKGDARFDMDPADLPPGSPFYAPVCASHGIRLARSSRMRKTARTRGERVLSLP